MPPKGIFPQKQRNKANRSGWRRWDICAIRGGDLYRRKTVTIKEVSEKYGVSQDTLRYYERVGMIPEVTRTAGGIRNYTQEDLGWLELALCMRSAGLPVNVLVEYLRLYRQGDSTIPQRLELLTAQRRELLEMKSNIEQTISRLDYKISVYEQGVKTGVLSWDEPEKCIGDDNG